MHAITANARSWREALKERAIEGSKLRGTWRGLEWWAELTMSSSNPTVFSCLSDQVSGLAWTHYGQLRRDTKASRRTIVMAKKHPAAAQ